MLNPLDFVVNYLLIGAAWRKGYIYFFELQEYWQSPVRTGDSQQ